FLFFFFFLLILPPPRSTLFPYTTLFRSFIWLPSRTSTAPSTIRCCSCVPMCLERRHSCKPPIVTGAISQRPIRHAFAFTTCRRTDRKSTRLNSSHVEISYAVFCLKKKKK